MDKGGLRVVGFTFSNHGESTLNAEVSNAKLQTQRSLLSELLAIHAIEGEEDDMSNGSESDNSDDDDEGYGVPGGEPPQVTRHGQFQRSSPIQIPYAESLANQRAKDAYRRLLYQRKVEQLYYQQQQQLQYQAHQQYLLQQQQGRKLQLLQQQQQHVTSTGHQTGQDRDDSIHECGPTPAVPVY